MTYNQSPLPSRSMTHVANVEYTWVINNFRDDNYRPGNGKQFESPIFPTNTLTGQSKWSIRLICPGDFYGICHKWLELSISHSGPEVSAKFAFSIINNMGERVFTFNAGPKMFTREDTKLHIQNFIQCGTLSNLGIIAYSLTIYCEIFSDQLNSIKFKVPENRLSEDLGTLLDNEKFNDVVLVANGHELKAHKGILAVRSKVFAAMFEHKMEEQKQNRVSIMDVDHNVLKELLHYMYTDKSPNLDTMAEDLLAAADKYDVQNLKIMCEQSLRTNITIEKAANTLILADRHNAQQLKLHTISYILSNATAVIETQGWDDMRGINSNLIEELFCAAAPHLKFLKLST